MSAWYKLFSSVNLSLKWQNINKIATESIAVVLTPENHYTNINYIFSNH